MTSSEEYRCADYDMDIYFDKTTSWPDGLSEGYRFEPNLHRAVRLTSSEEDIQRYKDHFSIAQTNQGYTWKEYLKIIRDDLSHFETLVLTNKAFPERLSNLGESEISSYVTTFEPECFKNSPLRNETIKKKSLEKTGGVEDTDSLSSMEYTTFNSHYSVTLPKHLPKTRESEVSHYVTASESDFSLSSSSIGRKSFIKTENVGDTDSQYSVGHLSTTSISSDISINNSVPLSPQKNLIQKFFTGVRQFASKTKKTVEKVSIKSKYCSACGDTIGRVKVQKECSQSSLSVLDYMKTRPPSRLKKNANLNRTISVRSLNSVASTCSSDSAVTIPSPQQAPAYHKKKKSKRMLPFIKESSEKI